MIDTIGVFAATLLHAILLPSKASHLGDLLILLGQIVSLLSLGILVRTRSDWEMTLSLSIAFAFLLPHFVLNKQILESITTFLRLGQSKIAQSCSGLLIVFLLWAVFYASMKGFSAEQSKKTDETSPPSNCPAIATSQPVANMQHMSKESYSKSLIEEQSMPNPKPDSPKDQTIKFVDF